MPENEVMNEPGLPAQTGRLQVRLVEESSRRPVEGAQVSITYEGDPESAVRRYTTNMSGMTELIELPAPNLEYSTQFSEPQPYAEYTVQVQAAGYEDAEVAGTEILPGVTAIQEIRMRPLAGGVLFDRIVIGPHTLFGDYPPKIAESEIKPVYETG